VQHSPDLSPFIISQLIIIIIIITNIITSSGI